MRKCGFLLSALFFLFIGFSCGGSSVSGDDDSAPPEDDGGIGGADDDTSDPGLPATKVDYTEALTLDTVQGSADHYDYDSDNYSVTTETLHGTEVIVAIHDSNLSESSLVKGRLRAITADTFSQNMIDCWHAAWHIFGGYRYDKFAVKVRSTSESASDFSLSEAGISVGSDGFEDDLEFNCHEMLHPWIGKLIAYESDGSENLFQEETWIGEGAVVYYSFRNIGQATSEADFRSGMDERRTDYEEIIGTELDLSIGELADLIGDDTSHEAVGILYARGALIAYLLDKQLVAAGFSLDDLMADLYENFGLTDTKYTQADVEASLIGITGSSYEDFFNTYLDANGEIDINGDFELFSRE